jgi:hypothetical protein
MVSFAVNALLLYALIKLSSDDGLVMSLGDFKKAAAMLLQILMHLSNEYTNYAMDAGLGAFVGYLISAPHGYSLAACGFVQSSTFQKFSFCNRLAFKSKCKKFLSRLSYVWILHLALIIISIPASITVHADQLLVEKGVVSCMVYGQAGEQYDRGWPNLFAAMGVGEYAFGSSLGILSSENGTPNSTFIFSPQLIDTCADGTTLFGAGFTTAIATSCVCSTSSTIHDLTVAGVNPSVIGAFQTEIDLLGKLPGMAVSMVQDSNTSLLITHAHTGTNICGDRNINVLIRRFPVCQTVITDHYHVIASMQYMTDGTPESITAKVK